MIIKIPRNNSYILTTFGWAIFFCLGVVFKKNIKLIKNKYTSCGSLILNLLLICMIYVLVEKCMGHVVSGWSSLMISIWLLGGIQLISISVIGEYIGKIFSEVKHRPRYTIEEENYTDKFNHRKNK